MKSAALVAVCLMSLCSLARAEQFVLVDVSYTHSADTTKDSHYYPKLAPDTPKDWTKPVDYSKGSVHIILDIKTKPAGDTPTKFQICFEGTPSYGCTAQSPTYTQTGRVEWDSPFSGFWYESTVDWSQGIKQMPLILKDTMNNKPAGDPKYMPTDLRVQVILVSAGAKFAPPPAAGSGAAGAAGAANGGAGAGGAAGMTAAGAGSGAGAGASGSRAGMGGSAGKPSTPAAGSGSPAGRSAANGGAPATAPTAGATSPTTSAGMSSPTPAGSGTTSSAQTAAASGGDSGCRSAGANNQAAWSLCLFLLYLARRRLPNRARER